MDSRWTYAYKTDSKGALRTDVHPYRSRFVGKGFTQQDGVNCFETFAPVISFVTLRLLFALTALPHFDVTVSQLSRYMIKPGPQHMAAAKKLLRYLQGRKKIPLRWCASDTRAPHRPGNIYGYADASFADDRAVSYTHLTLPTICSV